MALLNYTTKVDAFKTQSEISYILAKHGARAILQEFDDRGRVEAISFKLRTAVGDQAVRLPANVDAVFVVLKRQKVKCDRDQAERVAWRIVKDWVEAQMAILESEQVSMDQIFLPYMLNHQGQTFYELYASKQLMLTSEEVQS